MHDLPSRREGLEWCISARSPWPGRLTWSSSPAWSSCVPRTRCSTRCCGAGGPSRRHGGLWITERGGRLQPGCINDRFEAYRDALKLPKDLVPHSIRHSYVTHLTEDGVDRRFIQQQVGHECDSSTAIYTHVSDDFMNTALHKALAPAFAGV
ncbi:tyrosine-type recombinase/integrase [Streptomyces canus]|uniref:tyrosine-type recombinase/integrase n=1 Tax=Streptomyces canus TaxID=58343 RepID=UPI0033AD7B84